MLIINEEENKKLKNRNIFVPKYIRKLAMKVRKEYADKTDVGYKRISHILDDEYNKFKANDKNGNLTDSSDTDVNKMVKLPATTVKQVASALKSPGAINNPEAQQTIKSWAKNAVQSQRNQVKPVSSVKKPPKLSKPKPQKISDNSQKAAL